MEAIVKQSSSTGKAQAKRIQSIRAVQTDVKKKPEQHRFEPTRIKELSGQNNKLGSIHKDSEKKRFQPVRIPTLSNKKDIQQSLNKKDGDKENRSIYCSRPVRRNLNLNDYPINIDEDSNKHNSKMIVNRESILNVAPPNKTRKSFLLPPNFIKETHVKKYNGKVNKSLKGANHCEVLANIDTSSNTKICSIKEINTSDVITVPPVESDMPKKISNSVATGSCTEPGFTMILNEDKIVQSFACLNTCKINNSESIQITTNNVYSLANDKQVYKTPTKNQCNDLQSAELAEFPHNQNVEHVSTEMITISRQEILRLISSLKDSINATEKNLSVLKSTLTYYTRILNSENVEKKVNIMEEKQGSSESIHENNAILDKEIQLETCCKSAKLTKSSLVIPAQELPEVVLTDCENDKENQVNLDAKEHVGEAVDTVTDSFLELEEQLFITRPERIMDNKITRQSTPMNKKFKGKNIHASLKEYMTLKSTMSFFQTPDTDRFKSFHSQRDITNQCDYNKMYISKKAFSDLNNLYSESPEYS